MDAFKKGWFTETVNTDLAYSVEVEKVYYQNKSKYQDVMIFSSKTFGRVLALDNVIQSSELYDFPYQEMLTLLPLNSHPNPKKVLIIGGVDSIAVKLAVTHPSVDSVAVCEIDEKVIEGSKKFLPFTNEEYDTTKVSAHIDDGAEFVKKHQGEFDVIITDSPDPVGPAACLFKKLYYESLKQALRPGGILCSQGASFWFNLKLIKEMVKMCQTLFPVVDYGSSYLFYPGGQIGYLLCSTSQDTNFREPLHKFSLKTMKELKLKYYTPNIHRAAFVLPLFVAEEIGLKWEVGSDDSSQ